MDTPNTTIRIGVTGHRVLPHPQQTRQAVRAVLAEIFRLCSSKHPGGCQFEVISPLAEGADRLVAEEVLCFDHSSLVVPLPFPAEQYLLDFQTEQSRKEFHQLLAKASAVHTLSENVNRPLSYTNVGRYVVDHCYVLVALWNGVKKQNRGGTADIVEYARLLNKPAVLINTEDPAQIAAEHFDAFKKTK